MRNTNGSTTINKKAIILYYSHKGKTAAYAREITMYLWSKGLSVRLCSISDAKLEKLREYDYLITGCWTCGWFVVGQHPHKCWKDFSRQIQQSMHAEHTLLFTTYKIRTGSMYLRMKQALGIASKASIPFLKSRNGLLTEKDKAQLDLFIGISPNY